jgi:hypothetical protein
LLKATEAPEDDLDLIETRIGNLLRIVSLDNLEMLIGHDDLADLGPATSSAVGRPSLILTGTERACIELRQCS